MRYGRVLAWLVAAALPLAGSATDAPHDLSNLDQGGSGIDCQSCHMAHNASGAALTTTAGNANLCASCHTSTSTRYGFPWTSAEQATPGSTGISHRWDANATNTTLGTTAPSTTAGGGEAEMARRLVNGKLQCSTCHDQHNGATNFGGNVRTSVALAANLTRLAGTGTGNLQLTSVAGGKPAGYRIKLSAANAFKISHDRGVSWFGYDSVGKAWGGDGAAPYTSGQAFTAGTPVALDDGVTTVTFVASGATPWVAGDTWQDFYVSYPFLRMSNAGSAMCVVCHKDRNQSHARVTGADSSYVPNGTNVFHHPVNESLNVNGGGYDRGTSTTATVLDANGGQQGTVNGDTVPSNDILLGTNNTVQCLSCHRPHNADSNSMTDVP